MADTVQLLTDEEFAARVSELKGKRFDLLSNGFIELVDATGGDRRVVQAARTTSDLKAKSDKDDWNLIHYLMRHHHATPFEFCDVTLKICCPMDLWRQMIRHRAAAVNEYSTRYSPALDMTDTTESDKWRMQSKANRQGSSGAYVTDWPDGWSYNPDTGELARHDASGKESWTLSVAGDISTPGKFLSYEESELQGKAKKVYERRLALGVANEQARKDLPLSQYTVAYWKSNLRMVLHMLGLRMDSHAQLEIRQYANVIGNELVAKLYPATWDAHECYNLHAITLTELDIALLRVVIATRVLPIEDFTFLELAETIEAWTGLKSCRERDECLSKFKRLGIVRDASPIT